MITHYVYLSIHNDSGDLVIDAPAFRYGRKSHLGVLAYGESRRDWIPVEDCATRSEAHKKAKEITEVLEALEEPKSYDYGASVVLNENWTAVVIK